MNLPRLSKPVNRKQTANQKITKGVQPSCGDICQTCQRLCRRLPGFLQGRCRYACGLID